jgi:histone acetyltransferase (RNA polymerase elongator complex component)
MNQKKKPLVIPVFIPHSGCPHQCAFCNQTIITSQKARIPDKAAVHQVVTDYLEYKGKRTDVELAFFGGNFLGLAKQTVLQLLTLVQPYVLEGKIDGIRFSTRPDTITKQNLDLIKSYHISTIELGVQSMNEKVLLHSKRGHTVRDTVSAMGLLKEYPFKTGVQVMVGLPGDNEVSLLESTKKLARLAPDFARIYPLVVLKGSLMEHWYKKGRYQPLSLENSIGMVKKMYEIFKAAGVEVIRMGLQASDLMEDESMVLAGPWHPAFGHLVFSRLLYDIACTRIDGYQNLEKLKELFLRVHPRSESRLRGDKNANVNKLNLRYPGIRFSILTDEAIPMDHVEVGEK